MDNKIVRKTRRFTITDEAMDYLKDYAFDNSLPYNSVSLALEKILKEHNKNNNDNFSLDFMAKKISEEVGKSVQISLQHSISKEINKVRLASNNIDRNTQILIELVQGFMQHNGVEGIITTEINYPLFMNEVEKLIKERITKQKQKKDSK